MQDAMIQRLAEKDSQFYGQQISGSLTVAKSAAAGAIRDIKFLDTDTCFWQLTQQQTMQHKAHTADLIPHLGDLPAKCTQHHTLKKMHSTSGLPCHAEPSNYCVLHDIKSCKKRVWQHLRSADCIICLVIHASDPSPIVKIARCCTRHWTVSCRQDQRSAGTPLACGGLRYQASDA